jgi:hypothetical protein
LCWTCRFKVFCPSIGYDKKSFIKGPPEHAIELDPVKLKTFYVNVTKERKSLEEITDADIIKNCAVIDNETKKTNAKGETVKVVYCKLRSRLG